MTIILMVLIYDCVNVLDQNSSLFWVIYTSLSYNWLAIQFSINFIVIDYIFLIQYMGKNNDDNCILMFIFVLKGAKISKMFAWNWRQLQL